VTDAPHRSSAPDHAAPAAPSDDGFDSKGGRRRLSRRWLRRSLLLLGPLLVAVVAGYVYITSGRYVSTENAYVKADKVMIAAEVTGLITDVAVQENQRVAAGDVLFRIDERPYRIALSEAEAHLTNVRDEIASLKASYRQKAEELTLARTDVDFAQKEYDRQSKLVRTKVISASRFDAVEHDLDVARRRIDVIEQEMAQIKAELSGDPNIPIERHPRYLEAVAARDRAALDLERTVVRAPFRGIAGNAPQVGQQVIGNGPLSSPVMSIVSDAGVWIEANFKETDLTHVRSGQPVVVEIDAYPDREWAGTVQSLSQATGAEFSIIPPQNATGNWVKVVQRIPVRISVKVNRDDPVLRAGMSTSVEIDTGYHHPLPAFVQAMASWLGGASPASAANGY
jgi:membrane fusion protein (multidrug efflux system)